MIINNDNVLVVVSTALQYLNSIELIKKLQIKNSDLVVFCDSRRPKEMFLMLPEIDYWSSILFFSKNGSSSVDKYIFSKYIKRGLRFIHDTRRDFKILEDVRFFLRSVKDVDILILGNPNDMWQCHVGNSIRCKNIINCEDGTATLVADYNAGISQKTRSKLLNLKQKKIKSDIVFSTFDRSLNDGFIKNDYKYIQELVKAEDLLVEKTSVYFIGQPIYTLGFVSLEEYISILNDISESCYEDKNIFYYPHPGESAADLKIIEKKTNFNVSYSVSPIEIELILSKKLPCRFATFYSSAFFTINRIYQDSIPIDVYHPAFEQFSSQKVGVNNINKVYSEIRKKIQYPHKYFLISAKGSIVESRLN